MTSLVSKLKRRNVFRVAIACMVVAWVVLQVAEMLSPMLQLPAWTVPLVFYFGVIGFPFALAFARVFELTPEGLTLTSAVGPEVSVTGETGKTLTRTIIGLMPVAILLLAERFYKDMKVGEGAGLVATETVSEMAVLTPLSLNVGGVAFTR